MEEFDVKGHKRVATSTPHDVSIVPEVEADADADAIRSSMKSSPQMKANVSKLCPRQAQFMLSAKMNQK